VTSIRRGFSGGGFYGQQGLASKLALRAHLPGAQSIPAHAQGFLGFTTTLQSNMGPGIIANLETLPGVTNQWPNGYFRQGTTMQLSHLFQDLATWYGQGFLGFTTTLVSNMGPGIIANLETLPGLTNQWPNGYFKQGTTMQLSHLFQDLATWYEQSFPQYPRRVQAMIQPGLSPPPAPGTLTLEPPGQSEADVAHGVHRYHAYGHTGSLSAVDSTTSPTTSNYGVAYPTGTTIPVRGDFDTLDNPFYYTSDPAGDHYSNKKAAGLHFIMFQPTIAIFNRVRLAMDGHYSDKTLPVAPRSPHAGINSVLHTTHRQNYLVPPRRHRSFPLAEFLV